MMVMILLLLIMTMAVIMMIIMMAMITERNINIQDPPHPPPTHFSEFPHDICCPSGAPLRRNGNEEPIRSPLHFKGNSRPDYTVAPRVREATRGAFVLSRNPVKSTLKVG